MMALCRGFFMNSTVGAYKHDRVHALKCTLLAMEEDRELVLERTHEHHKGRITGVRLIRKSL